MNSRKAILSLATAGLFVGGYGARRGEHSESESIEVILPEDRPVIKHRKYQLAPEPYGPPRPETRQQRRYRERQEAKSSPK